MGVKGLSVLGVVLLAFLLYGGLTGLISRIESDEYYAACVAWFVGMILFIAANVYWYIKCAIWMGGSYT